MAQLNIAKSQIKNGKECCGEQCNEEECLVVLGKSEPSKCRVQRDRPSPYSDDGSRRAEAAADVQDQITRASAWNATVSRRFAGFSTASS
jgi:hypothetical protein